MFSARICTLVIRIRGFCADVYERLCAAIQKTAKDVEDWSFVTMQGFIERLLALDLTAERNELVLRLNEYNLCSEWMQANSL